MNLNTPQFNKKWTSQFQPKQTYLPTNILHNHQGANQSLYIMSYLLIMPLNGPFKQKYEKYEIKHVSSTYSHAKVRISREKKVIFSIELHIWAARVRGDYFTRHRHRHRERVKRVFKFHCLYWYVCDSSVTEQQQISS